MARRRHEFDPNRLREIIAMCDEVQASPRVSVEDKAFIGSVRRKCERRLAEGLHEQVAMASIPPRSPIRSFSELATALNARGVG